MNSVYIILILLVFTPSCSNIPITSNAGHKSFSTDVEDEFKSIENTNIHNLYKEMRLKNWEAYKKGGKIAPIYKRKTIKKADFKKVPQKPRSKAKLSSSAKLEIGQNIEYFCIKYPDSHKYENTKQCHKFAHKLLKKCKERHKFSSRRIVRCIKNRLKRSP